MFKDDLQNIISEDTFLELSFLGMWKVEWWQVEWQQVEWSFFASATWELFPLSHIHSLSNFCFVFTFLVQVWPVLILIGPMASIQAKDSMCNSVSCRTTYVNATFLLSDPLVQFSERIHSGTGDVDLICFHKKNVQQLRKQLVAIVNYKKDEYNLLRSIFKIILRPVMCILSDLIFAKLYYCSLQPNNTICKFALFHVANSN